LSLNVFICFAAKPSLAVGIALRQQLLPPGVNLPADEHDWPVDEVVVADVE
jgi:5-formyltetrahydrofolate cyclo-ligase